MTNKYPDFPDNKNLKKYIKEHIVDMDNKELVKKLYNKNMPEIIVDYTKQEEGEVKINPFFLTQIIITLLYIYF